MKYDRSRQWEVIASGESDAVGGVGELVEVTLSHVGPALAVAIGDSVVFRTTEFGPGDAYRTEYLGLAVWPAPGTSTPKTAVFDWVEVTRGHSEDGVAEDRIEVEGVQRTLPRNRRWTPDWFANPAHPDALRATSAAGGPVHDARSAVRPSRKGWSGRKWFLSRPSSIQLKGRHLK